MNDTTFCHIPKRPFSQCNVFQNTKPYMIMILSNNRVAIKNP